MSSTTIIDSYSTGMKKDIIKLKVTVSNVQIAKSTLRKDKTVIGNFEDSFELDLGKGNEILGSVFYIDTTEADIDPNTNTLSFKLELSGGACKYENSRTQTVMSGGYVLYTAEITMIP